MTAGQNAVFKIDNYTELVRTDATQRRAVNCDRLPSLHRELAV